MSTTIIYNVLRVCKGLMYINVNNFISKISEIPIFSKDFFRVSFLAESMEIAAS